MRIVPNTILLLVFLVAISCSEQSATKQMAPQQIPVVQVIQKNVPIYREFVGQAYGLQDIPVRARVEGFLEGIHFQEGFAVRKGQLLYSIDPQPFEASVAARQSDVAEAQTYLVNAENELARYKPLAAINAVSKSDLDAAQASRDAAVASLEAAKANLDMAKIDLSYTKIYSPINGVIGKTEARVGEFVGREPNPVILNTVSKIERARVQFFLTEAEYLLIAREFSQSMKKVSELQKRSETAPRDNVQLILADGTLYDQVGSVDFIDRGVDATTGSILVQATFANPNGLLRPGMFTKVRILFEEREGGLLVPQRCVMELQGQHSVYIVDQNNTVQSRQVTATEKVGDLWLITEGLEATDRVVIDALQKVATGVVVDPQEMQYESKNEG